MQIIGRVRSVASETLVRLNIVVQIVIVVLACLIVGGLIFWLCNELVYYFVARGYAEELADAYDLNPGVAKAVLWASFAAIVVLAGYSLSLSKQKRRMFGIGGAGAENTSSMTVRVSTNDLVTNS